jgi:hypothetical protein
VEAMLPECILKDVLSMSKNEEDEKENDRKLVQKYENRLQARESMGIPNCYFGY